MNSTVQDIGTKNHEEICEWRSCGSDCHVRGCLGTSGGHAGASLPATQSTMIIERNCTMKRDYCVSVTLPVILTVLASSAVGRADISLLADADTKVQPVVTMQAQPFELERVRLLAGPFLDAMHRDGQYLLGLDADRLLHTFRLNAGLPSSAEPLGGWEAPECEVRGHFVGHYLSGCALMYAATGEEPYRQRAAMMVEELAKCQRALGASGYLSAIPSPSSIASKRSSRYGHPTIRCTRSWPVCWKCTSNAKMPRPWRSPKVWPAGAKLVVTSCRTNKCSRCSISTEQGGMDEALANLYALTGKPEYLALSRRFVQRTYNDPLAAGRDELRGQHVNSFIPNIIGTARQYELTGNQEDHQVAHFFWHQVTAHRCYCTGGTSNREHWRTEPDHLAGELGDHTQENCCTYNLLKLTRHLFAWEPQSTYADYYERALWNSILSTQDPQTGMMMYFVTLGTGRWKYFNVPTDAFWCCTGTGVENHAQYGDSIYFHDQRGVVRQSIHPVRTELDGEGRPDPSGNVVPRSLRHDTQGVWRATYRVHATRSYPRVGHARNSRSHERRIGERPTRWRRVTSR